MSLKAFHIVFVAATALLAFGIGGWLINDYQESESTKHLIFGILSILGGVGMLIYGKIVLKKLKHISYL